MVLIIRTSQLAFKWWSCVLKCYKYSASQSYWYPNDELKRFLKRGKFRKLRVLYSFVRLWLLCEFILIHLHLHCENIFLLRKCVNYCFSVQCFVSAERLCPASTAVLSNVFSGIQSRSAVYVPVTVTTWLNTYVKVPWFSNHHAVTKTEIQIFCSLWLVFCWS